MRLVFRSLQNALRSPQGFTLIELLVVIAILGTLVTIAIPSMTRYQAEGYCGRVVSDARQALVSMEAHFSRTFEYGDLADTIFVPSEDVTVTVESTDPLTIAATDDTGQCPKGVTFTLVHGEGTWQ